MLVGHRAQLSSGPFKRETGGASEELSSLEGRRAVGWQGSTFAHRGGLQFGLEELEEREEDGGLHHLLAHARPLHRTALQFKQLFHLKHENHSQQIRIFS